MTVPKRNQPYGNVCIMHRKKLDIFNLIHLRHYYVNLCIDANGNNFHQFTLTYPPKQATKWKAYNCKWCFRFFDLILLTVQTQSAQNRGTELRYSNPGLNRFRLDLWSRYVALFLFNFSISSVSTPLHAYLPPACSISPNLYVYTTGNLGDASS